MSLLIVILIILLLFGGLGYRNRGDWGMAPIGGVGMLLVIVLILWLVGVIR